MNRFSKDIESIDQRLMPQLFQLVAGVGSLISTVVILGYSTPIMLGKSKRPVSSSISAHALVSLRIPDDHRLLVCAQILPQVPS
jgi:hypothetical protein